MEAASGRPSETRESSVIDSAVLGIVAQCTMQSRQARGAPPTPDPRLLEWPTPKTNTPPSKVNLAYSTTKQVRQTYLAHDWAERAA